MTANESRPPQAAPDHFDSLDSTADAVARLIDGDASALEHVVILPDGDSKPLRDCTAFDLDRMNAGMEYRARLAQIDADEAEHWLQVRRRERLAAL